MRKTSVRVEELWTLASMVSGRDHVAESHGLEPKIIAKTWSLGCLTVELTLDITFEAVGDTREAGEGRLGR